MYLTSDTYLRVTLPERMHGGRADDKLSFSSITTVLSIPTSTPTLLPHALTRHLTSPPMVSITARDCPSTMIIRSSAYAHSLQDRTRSPYRGFIMRFHMNGPQMEP
ncbi:hypothetical protein FF38_00609 [Lucilia cuprina]|uniref:Uncharacterized protein n=1 Tax=Lucilia cuprina TaxID=7375 RepID=A0A0L0C678_LUCCU|nr:hypothetical protein FF38_00609 [Lucilia cuprina]